MVNSYKDKQKFHNISRTPPPQRKKNIPVFKGAPKIAAAGEKGSHFTIRESSPMGPMQGPSFPIQKASVWCTWDLNGARIINLEGPNRLNLKPAGRVLLEWLFCGKKQDKKPIMVEHQFDHEIKHSKSSYIIYIYCWNIHENMAEKSLMHSTLPYHSPPRLAHSVMMYKTYLIASQLVEFWSNVIVSWCKQHRSESMKKFCDRLLLKS